MYVCMVYVCMYVHIHTYRALNRVCVVRIQRFVQVALWTEACFDAALQLAALHRGLPQPKPATFSGSLLTAYGDKNVLGLGVQAVVKGLRVDNPKGPCTQKLYAWLQSSHYLGTLGSKYTHMDTWTQRAAWGFLVVRIWGILGYIDPLNKVPLNFFREPEVG